ncbi:MAG: hypothetical protein IKY09_02675 [Methanocorpusculum sp.]|nr:hypothetical protein [Methanocorpusculum sp.]MBR5451041.1 hypothetical protein [Methanocorpusculum sp.]
MAAEKFDMAIYKKTLKKADKKQGYQPEPSGIENPNPPNTGSHVTKTRSKFRHIGIPLEDVGKRLLALNKAIDEHNMGISANAQYNLEFLEGHDDVVKKVIMEVYFFED